ncbi:ATP-binding protein [Xanthobacteraceae bacterium Astr-EGSB]|uniref:ATP-binding protein n=1 Tax=Astrobacterium formosum TaxID=3069710 RepID=UPI0027B258DA|nr:ATP-binding protein [Xanthobacteraceae bacterium Astr-EGSB]
MMPEITVVSGKGGTGKTSVTAAFAKLAGRAIVCDLDVDAADLHILLQPQIIDTHDFYAGQTAVLDPDACTQCRACESYCRFDAIVATAQEITFDPSRCEGCGICAHFCPFGAIEMRPRLSGRWFRSHAATGAMLHGELHPGQENSGLLVTRLREEAHAAFRAGSFDYIIADGPPGIGCPVIGAVTGTGFVVAVTEPTVSGVHDLLRVAALCEHFRLPTGVVLNKADLDLPLAGFVETFCAERGYPLLARIPYLPAVVQALTEGRTMDEVDEGGVADSVHSAWETVAAQFKSSSEAIQQVE